MYRFHLEFVVRPDNMFGPDIDWKCNVTAACEICARRYVIEGAHNDGYHVLRFTRITRKATSHDL